MVDAVVTVFLEKLLGALSEGGRILVEFRDQLEKLQNELQLMQSFLRDAERQKRKNNTLQHVLVELRETIYQAEDMLADLQLKAADADDPTSSSTATATATAAAWLKCFNPLKIPFRMYAGRQLEEMLAKIVDLKDKIKTYLGVGKGEIGPHDDQIPSWSSPVYDHTQVVGLEGDTRKLKEWLREGDVEMLTVGVVGMGGLGKTTIAQKVFNERDMEDYFERRIWVSVSQTFKERQILRNMLSSLGDASPEDSEGELLRKINQYLQGKRFLIVMDDVWDRDDMSWWNRIYEGLPKGNGSGIIITTRSTRVAQRMRVKEKRMHYPKCLNKGNSWLLFRKIAFAATNGECNYPELVGVGEEIVDKCKGLPLAIKAVGGIMLTKSPLYSEWRRIADYFRDELADNDNSVMASLQLSYDELPSYLKPCFLCLSIYPEDCVITKDQLVHWWIGEGFVPIRRGRSATEAGEDCFAGLTNRCLLEVVDKTYYGAIDTCTTHDMVRDLVVKIARANAFSENTDDVLSSSTRHLSLDAPIAHRQFPSNPNLRALLSTTKSGEVNKIPSTVAKTLPAARYLRALDLSRSILGAPLSGLGALQHLSYLGLSNTHPLVHLPNSLHNLHCLQVLDLSYCQNLKALPPSLLAMHKLRVLDVSHCGSLHHLPKGLGRLSRLEVLLGFKPAGPGRPEGCRIGEIRNLIRLRKLGLCLSRGNEISDAELHTLVKLGELRSLSISCYTSAGADVAARLDRLYPPRQVEELSLRFFPGRVSPAWLEPASLPMLKHLAVCSGDLRGVGEGFWGVDAASFWGVEALLLESLSELEVEWERVRKVMPRLRVVCASWCPELVSFPIEDIGFRGGVWKKEDQVTN